MRLDGAGWGKTVKQGNAPGPCAHWDAAQYERTSLSDELFSDGDSATARERARAFIVVAGIFGSAALAASLALHITQGAVLSVVALALIAIGGVVARRFGRI